MFTFSAGPYPWASPGERPTLDDTEELLTEIQQRSAGDSGTGDEALPIQPTQRRAADGGVDDETATVQPHTVVARQAQRERPMLHSRADRGQAPAPAAPPMPHDPIDKIEAPAPKAPASVKPVTGAPAFEASDVWEGMDDSFDDAFLADVDKCVQEHYIQRRAPAHQPPSSAPAGPLPAGFRAKRSLSHASCAPPRPAAPPQPPPAVAAAVAASSWVCGDRSFGAAGVASADAGLAAPSSAAAGHPPLRGGKPRRCSICRQEGASTPTPSPRALRQGGSRPNSANRDDATASALAGHTKKTCPYNK